MSWRREPFRQHYRAAIGTVASSNCYVSYLNLVDELVCGLDERLAEIGGTDVLVYVSSQPNQNFSKARSRKNCESALRAYILFGDKAKPYPEFPASQLQSRATVKDELDDVLRQAKQLAARYYKITGKPLGITGEIAELEAANRLDLLLLEARSPDADALRGEAWRVQIKGRAVSLEDRYRGQCPAIKGDQFDSVILVLLNRTSYDVLEIWEAPRDLVLARITAPGGRARNERRSLAISQFKSIAARVWPVPIKP